MRQLVRPSIPGVAARFHTLCLAPTIRPHAPQAVGRRVRRDRALFLCVTYPGRESNPLLAVKSRASYR